MQFSLILLIVLIFLEPFLPVKAFVWSNLSYQFILWVLLLRLVGTSAGLSTSTSGDLSTSRSGRFVFAGLVCAIFFRPAICGLTFPISNSFYLILLSGIFLISFFGRREQVWRKTLLDIPILSFLILATGYMLLSLDKTTGLRQVISLWGAGILYFILVREIKDAAAARDLVVVFFMGALRIMVHGLYQLWVGFAETKLWIETYTQGELGARLLDRLSSGRVFSNFVYPNAYAGFLIMLIPVALALLWQFTPRRRQGMDRPKGYKRIAVGSFLGLSLFSLYITYSKGGWLSLTLIALAAFIFLFPGIKGARKLFIILLTLILIIVVVSMLESTGSTKLGFTKSFKVRWEYWQASCLMIRDNFFRGYGLGNFGEIYAQYKLPMAEETQMAHNNYLQVWVEMGIVGFIILLWLVVRFIRVGLFSPQQISGARTLAQGAFWGGSAFFVHSLVDFDFYVPNLIFSAFFLIGVTAALNIHTLKGTGTLIPIRAQAGTGRMASPSGATRGLVRNSLYPILGVVIFLGVFCSQIKYINYLYRLERMEGLVAEMDFDKAEEEINGLLKESGFNPRLHFEKGRLSEIKAFTGKEKRKSDFIDAVYEYSLASSLNPYRAGYHFRLGMLYWAFRDDPFFRKRAVSEFRLAHEAYPTKKEYIEILKSAGQYSGNEK